MSTIKATWTNVPLQGLPSHLAARSSHSLALLNGIAYVFGGEKRPRTPIGDEVLVVNTQTRQSSVIANDGKQSWPQARIGAAVAKNSADGTLYMWGGRAGKEMAPIAVRSSEHMDGEGVWCFDPKSKAWTQVDVCADSPVARSYHTMTYAEPNLFLHAGCPVNGRLSSLHAFHPPSQSWKEFEQAPEPARGGTVLAALSGDRLIRWGGFCGHELGGPLDMYDVKTNSWTSHDVKNDPATRSVHGLVPFASKKATQVNLDGDHFEVLAVLFMGEGSGAPLELGHDGAGKFLNDVHGLLHDRRKETYVWRELHADAPEGVPEARGWFAFDVEAAHDDNAINIVLHGGLNEQNERLADAWILHVSVQ